MKKHEHSLGFGAIETLLILASVGILGFVGWYVWHAKNNADTSLKSATTASVNSSPQVKNKTYTNTEYGFSFQYPETWSFSEKLSDLGGGHNEGDIVVTSPKDTKVHFGPNLGGKGGDCADPDTETRTKKYCETRNILYLETLPTSSAAKPVYFYQASLTASDRDGGKTIYYIDIESRTLPLSKGSVTGNFLYPYDEISTRTGEVTVFVEGSDDIKNDTPAFFDTREVKEATPILKSFQLLN